MQFLDLRPHAVESACDIKQYAAARPLVETVIAKMIEKTQGGQAKKETSNIVLYRNQSSPVNVFSRPCTGSTAK